VILLAGFIHPLAHILKNHPLEYIYFNELLSAEKAYGRFENDYYMNSLKQGAEWLIENELNEQKKADGSKYTISTNGSVTYYLRNESDYAKPLYTRYYDRGQKDWDYGVFFCNYIHPHQLKNGLWPPAGTIETIDVNGIPVCAIVKRETRDDFLALQMIDRGDLQYGIPALEKVNREYPTNEFVKLRLAEAYLRTRQFGKVHPVMDECLEIYPEYDKALNLKGIAYMESGDYHNARTIFLQIIRINYRFAAAYHNIGLLYARQQPPDIAMAVSYFQQSIKANGRYKPSYVALASIYRQQGRTAEAQRMENMASRL
jgi:tetratricopeptide (TPR) repeat protein